MTLEKAVKRLKRKSAPVAPQPVEVEDADAPAARPAKRARTQAELDRLAEEQSAAEEEEQPVLSKKEARKKKRKPEDVEEPAQKATAAKPSRSQHGVWIGNLAFMTTSDKLKSFLEDGGCTPPSRINMPGGRRPNEKNRGFAYVDFDDEPSAKSAVSLSEGHLDGRKLLIKLNNDFEGRPAGATPTQGLSKTAKRIADRQKNAPCPCLFLGNLGFDVNDDRLRNMFEGNHLAALKWLPKEKLAAMRGDDKGKRKRAKDEDKDSGSDESDEEEKSATLKARESTGIRKVRVGTFEDSGKCKGWAFIDFHTTEQATAALLNPQNHHLDMRNIVVEYATPDAVRRGGHKVAAGERQRLSGPRRPPVEAPAPALVEETVPEPVVEQVAPAESKSKPLKPHKERSGRSSRPKVTPGAALAKAQRAKTGIAEASGKKIVF